MRLCRLSIVCIQPSNEELSLFESKQKLSWSSLNEHLINHLYNALHGLRREIHLIHEKRSRFATKNIQKQTQTPALDRQRVRKKTENFFLGYRYSAVGRLLMAIKISQKNQRFLDGFSFFAAAARCCRVVSLFCCPFYSNFFLLSLLAAPVETLCYFFSPSLVVWSPEVLYEFGGEISDNS